jgi:hypothetical protein
LLNCATKPLVRAMHGYKCLATPYPGGFSHVRDIRCMIGLYHQGARSRSTPIMIAPWRSPYKLSMRRFRQVQCIVHAIFSVDP